MYWKMSVDLSRALVGSMGHHDPLDALITYLELRANSARFGSSMSDINLQSEIADCQAMCEAKSWATEDPLGTGSLLVDTWRLEQIKTRMDISVSMDLTSLLTDCESGLEAFQLSGILNYPAQHRLAFRELGLSTGLHALARLNDWARHNTSRFSSTERRQLARLGKFSYLSGVIEGFWLLPANRQVGAWREHADINSVMLATSLAPDGYLASCPQNC
jgi:hypothetical protein